MGKRKLDKSANDSLPVTPKRSRVPGGILKAEGTPTAGHNRSVTFPPPPELEDRLKMFARDDVEVGEDEMPSLLAALENLRGPSLILWLQELQRCVGVLGSQVRMEDFALEILKLRWADQGEAVAAAFIEFLVHLISANVKFVKPAVKYLVENLKGTNDKNNDSEMLQNTHEAFKGLLEVAPVTSRDEILRHVVGRFPFYKMPTHKHVCFVSALLEMTRYIPDSKDQILRLVMERLIKLDAHLNRDYIEEAYNKQSEEDCDLEVTVRTLDMYMMLMFTFIKESTHDHTESGEVVFNREKAESLVESLFDIHVSHVLPTFNILHTQFLYLYLGSLAPDISVKYLTKNWKVFTNPNQPSIIRQTAMAYIASYLARAKCVTPSLVLAYLDRLSAWALEYLRTREVSAQGLDFMHTDISKHGAFYSACQAIFYVFTFRHSDLTSRPETVKRLQGMSWQTLITSSLNPLRVCLPGIVKNFSDLAKNYQLAYCTAIVQRNNRINLPVVGSMSSSKAKPLLLDCFFPFDPYMLEDSQTFVTNIYRPFTGEFIDDSEDEEASSEEEDEEEDVETPDSGLGRRKKRCDSIRSSTSSCGRMRKDSMGHLNDLIMQDIVSPPGFK